MTFLQDQLCVVQDAIARKNIELEKANAIKCHTNYERNRKSKLTLRLLQTRERWKLQLKNLKCKKKCTQMRLPPARREIRTTFLQFS